MRLVRTRFLKNRNLSFFLSFLFPGAASTFQPRSSAVDIRDVIIIKFIVIYHCLSTCSIHRYGEVVAHVQVERHRLKPCPLLGNCIATLNTSISLCLSLNSWLTKSQVLIVIHEGNLRSGLTSVG